MVGADSVKRGQRVRILACPSNQVEHVGQVGSVVSTRLDQMRIYVNAGLCRATEVAPLSGEAVGKVGSEDPSRGAERPAD